MNAHYEMSHDEIARTRLNGLKRQHRELDEAIGQLASDGVVSVSYTHLRAHET